MWFYCLLTISVLPLAYGMQVNCNGTVVNIDNNWNVDVEAALQKQCPYKRRDLKFSWTLFCILVTEYAEKSERTSYWRPHEVSYKDGQSTDAFGLMYSLKYYHYSWFRYLLCKSAAEVPKNKFYACGKYDRRDSGLWLGGEHVFGCIFHPYEGV